LCLCSSLLSLYSSGDQLINPPWQAASIQVLTWIHSWLCAYTWHLQVAGEKYETRLTGFMFKPGSWHSQGPTLWPPSNPVVVPGMFKFSHPDNYVTPSFLSSKLSLSFPSTSFLIFFAFLLLNLTFAFGFLSGLILAPLFYQWTTCWVISSCGRNAIFMLMIL
jgi:hypothetical protein